MEITAHTLVRNEERYLWFSVLSVIDHVDKLLLWDTGSSDRTKDVIQLLAERYPTKISIRFLTSVSPEEFTGVRQQMLDVTTTEWFLVVDGDEIWYDESIKKIRKTITNYGSALETIVVPTINLVGDIYHYQEDAAGNYRLAGKHGNLSLRAVNRSIPGLSSSKPHGTWGWTDGRGAMLQERNPAKMQFVQAPYLHATFLPRAGKRVADMAVPKRSAKLKLELGQEFTRDFYYPESLFLPRPDFIPSPWWTMSSSYRFRAALITPLKKIRRRIVQPKVGY